MGWEPLRMGIIGDVEDLLTPRRDGPCSAGGTISGVQEANVGVAMLPVVPGEERLAEAAGFRVLAVIAWSPSRTPSFVVLSGGAEELSHEKDFQGQGLAGISAGLGI